MKTRLPLSLFLPALACGLPLLTSNALATDAAYVHVVKKDLDDTRFHLGEVEAFANSGVPDDLGGSEWDGMSTSTNDIGDGTLTTFGDGNLYPELGTTESLEHGGANKDPNNVLENVGNVWSTGSGLPEESQYTLDLGGTFDVTTVRMWPRADECCSTRWMNLEIQLLDADRNPVPGTLNTHTDDEGNVALEFDYPPSTLAIKGIELDPTVTFPDDDSVVLSTAAVGTSVGSFTALNEFGAPLAGATFSLVAGDGDTDNGLYAIGGPGGDQLLVNAALPDTNDAPQSVRVRADAGGGPFDGILTFKVKRDSDNDGLIDDWELMFGTLPDFATGGDADSDALKDEDEFVEATDPSKDDTDGDDSKDGAEITIGTDPLDPDTDDDALNDGGEVAAGSDPFNPDTDGDTLTDGSEVAANPFSTDPTKADTDGDTFNDDIEIQLETDPTDPNDFPVNETNLLAYWEFNDVDDPDNAVDTVNGHSGIVDGGAAYTDDAGGRTGGAGDYAMDFGFDSAGQTVQVEDGTFLNEAGAFDQITLAFWQRLEAVASTSAFWGVSPSSSGQERGIQAHTPWGDGTVYFDTAGCCDAATQRINGIPNAIVDDGEWHHFVFLKNGEVKEIWIDGELELDGINDSPLPNDFTEFWMGSFAGGGSSLQGALDDFAIFSNALSEEQIAQLAAGASALDLVVAPAPFIMTDIVVDPAANEVKLTWNSKTGQEFAVDFSLDLTADNWAELDDGIPSQGASTTYTVRNVPDGQKSGYYRAREL